jgi:hypothetical protein
MLHKVIISEVCKGGNWGRPQNEETCEKMHKELGECDDSLTLILWSPTGLLWFLDLVSPVQLM